MARWVLLLYLASPLIMEVIEKVIKYRHGGCIHLYATGDEHSGTKFCAEGKLKDKVLQIKQDPVGYWIGMGDKGDFITPGDPRWEVGIIADWVHQNNIAEDQTEWYCKTYEPIADKCVGLLKGNHEDAICRHNHVNVQANICRRLNVPDLGYSTWVRFKFERKGSAETHIIDGVFTHGAGWAITKGAKLNRLENFMNSFNARIFAIGHMHDIILETGKAYLDLTPAGKIKQRVKVGAITGCWFKTYNQGGTASYGEKKGYPPTEIGCPVFTIYPDKDMLTVSGSV